MPPLRNMQDCFWEKVNKTETCWLWTGAKSTNGYGQLHITQQRKHTAAHRYSYTMHIGSIPDNLCVLHKCDTPACVRTDHLFLGTKKDNTRDAINKGRLQKGTKNGMAILTEELVVQLRTEAANKSDDISRVKHFKNIAHKYNIKPETIPTILAGETWKHIPQGIIPRVPVKSALERIEEALCKTNTIHCWLWKGCLTKFGYPVAHLNGKVYLIRKFLWEQKYGKTSFRTRVYNTCGNKLCCNPEHHSLHAAMALAK